MVIVMGRWSEPRSPSTAHTVPGDQAFLTVLKSNVLRPPVSRLIRVVVPSLRVLVLLRRTIMALENGHSERQHPLGVSREDSEGGGAKYNRRGIARGNQSPLQPVLKCMWPLFVQLAFRVGCWTYQLDVRFEQRRCPGCWRARRTTSVRFDVVMQSAFQDKFPYIMTVPTYWAGDW